jgi:hypothetical protein
MGFVREYQDGDASILVPILRTADWQEMLAISTGDLVTRLREGAEHSVPSCTILDNHGVVAGMFGVVPHGDFGQIWMVGADTLTRPPLSRQFIRECRTHLSVMERPFLAVGNKIDERNTLHIRWLRWLGFSFVNRIPSYGVEGRPFLEFIKLCNDTERMGYRPNRAVSEGAAKELVRNDT